VIMATLFFNSIILAPHKNLIRPGKSNLLFSIKRFYLS
jgi:hypothetical protein